MADSLPVSGRIDPKSFPFLLIDLHRHNATGSLKVEGAHHQKALYFRSGRVLFGSSNDPKDQLGAILIESGKITEQQLEDVNKNVGPGNPLAKVLSDSGIVSQRELSDAARSKVERILSDVVSYTTGGFEFEDGVLPKGAVDLKLAPERLVIAAVRRVGDRAFVLRHLESLDVLLQPKPELQPLLGEIESEVGGLVAHLDGGTTLKEAAGRAAMDEFEAAKIACGLLFLGLVEKASGQVLAEPDESASPFFQASEETVTDLNLAQGSSPNLSFGSMEAEAETAVMASPEDFAIPMPSTASSGGSDAEATLVMGDLPSFSLPHLDSSAHVAPEPAPLPLIPPPPPTPPAASGPTPLKIIAPPKAAERTRPPAKPSKQDLAALDELLGKRSPEGPLTPIQKPSEEEWKPQFLPPQGGSKGRKQAKAGSLNRTAILGGGLGLVLVAGAVGGWWYWSRQKPAPVRVAAATPPSTAAPDPATTLAAAASSTPVAASPGAGAAVSPTPASVAPPTTTAPAPTPAPATKASAPPPSTTAPPAKATPAGKPTPEPKTSAAPPPKASPTAGHPAATGVAEARALLHKGQYTEAAHAFQTYLKEGKASYSIQILLACSTETIQKAIASVSSDDLLILPIHYRGKECYRLAWGVYESEAKAGAGLHGVPEYFHQGGAKPKVVTVAEILR